MIAAIANLSAGARLVLVSARLDAASAALGSVETILDVSQPAAVNARYDAMPADAPGREMGRQFELRETRQAQLVRAQQQFAATVQAHQLEGPLFEQAEQAIHDLEIRKLLATVAVLLAAGVAASGVAAVAGDFAAGLAGGGRTVATVGEAAGAMRTARVVGGVTQATVDAGLNATAQTAVSGDPLGSSFVENLLTNAAVIAALQPLHAVIRSWGGLDEQAYALWAQQGARGKLALARTATVSADLIASAATAYVVHRLAAGARGETPDEQTLASWALQGATMTLAHVISQRLEGALARLRGVGSRAGELVARLHQQHRLAQHIATVEPVDRGLALQLLVEHQLALEREIALWREVAGDPAALHATGLDAIQVEAKLAGAQAQRADTQGQVFDVLALRFAGLSPEVEGGRLWVGDTEQIATAVAALHAAHLDLAVEPPPPPPAGAEPTARIWRVTRQGETVEIRERVPVGREELRGGKVTAKHDHIERVPQKGDDGHEYQYDQMQPGPLSDRKTYDPNNMGVQLPAQGFYGAKYDGVTLSEDMVFYRVGNAEREWGEWFTDQPIQSEAQYRIDLAVKREWSDPKTGEMPPNSTRSQKQLELWCYTILIPKGTTVYTGQVASQGGIFMGGLGSGSKQYFIPKPWTLQPTGARVIARAPFNVDGHVQPRTSDSPPQATGSGKEPKQ